MKIFYLLYDSVSRFIECGAGYYAAAFSYYAPLALVPLVYFSVKIVGFFYGDAFTTQVFSTWGSALGEDLLSIIRIAVDNLGNETEASKFTIFGAMLFLGFCIVALNVMSDGFQDLWGKQTRGVKAWFIKSFRSIGFIFILQVYLIFVIGLEFFVAPTIFGHSPYVSSLILFFSTMAFFFTLYKLLVANSPSAKGCLWGAGISSIFFVMAKTIVDFYVITTPVITLYGAAGLLLILLVWVYVLAVIIYYGATVASLYDKINLSSVSNK